ncbi:MAG: hypothetical protein IJZ16_07055 [Clostridia bacterium]|nr:hypothetical protein [Clostridia bacterium]
MKIVKNIISWIVILVLLGIGGWLLYDGLSGIADNAKEEKTTAVTATEMLSPGEVFEPGKYIEADGVEILYDGEIFLVKNNRSDIVRVLCSVVGVKNDGTYETIQTASFVGVDETQYEKDKTENGWAIENLTNLIRPNETLEATLTMYDFEKVDDSYPENDVDGDGYIDLVFTISPQTDEETIRTSTNDYKSEIYKIKDK